MKRIAFLIIAIAAVGGVVASLAPASGRADDEAAVPIFGIKMPAGYRDWRLVSVAHEEGSLHSFAAILGNDVTIKAYREGKLPFPDGSIIAALHYGHVASEENNRVFGDPQSFVPGPPTNVQFMVKDSKKFASTGGWGSLTLGPTGNLAARRCSKPARLATRWLPAILFLRGMRLDREGRQNGSGFRADPLDRKSCGAS